MVVGHNHFEWLYVTGFVEPVTGRVERLHNISEASSSCSSISPDWSASARVSTSHSPGARSVRMNLLLPLSTNWAFRCPADTEMRMQRVGIAQVDWPRSLGELLMQPRRRQLTREAKEMVTAPRTVAIGFTVQRLILVDFSHLEQFVLSVAIWQSVYLAIVVRLFSVTRPLQLAHRCCMTSVQSTCGVVCKWECEGYG